MHHAALLIIANCCPSLLELQCKAALVTVHLGKALFVDLAFDVVEARCYGFK